jgi:hypothetical protein
VGAGEADEVETGNQWILMVVPSNDVRFQSDGVPATAVAAGGVVDPGRVQEAVVAAADVVDEVESAVDEEQAPSSRVARSGTAIHGRTVRRPWVAGAAVCWFITSGVLHSPVGPAIDGAR